MDNDIIRIRAYTRAGLAALLVVALVITVWVLLRELSDQDTEPALVTLLGAITGGLSTALVNIVNAIASNPSDRSNEGPEA